MSRRILNLYVILALVLGPLMYAYADAVIDRVPLPPNREIAQSISADDRGDFAASISSCNCQLRCDFDSDGFLTAIDLGELIDVLFAGKSEVQDPNCPTNRGDFDYDGFPDGRDLGKLIDHLFAGGPGPCDPCNPVQSSCEP